MPWVRRAWGGSSVAEEQLPAVPAPGRFGLGVGNLVAIGKWSATANAKGSGYGRGAGGLGGRRSGAPEVLPGVASVRGSLDKEIIRRIIRRHINEVRFCHEQELTNAPTLGGRILVLFTIAASGDVITNAASTRLATDAASRKNR